MNRIYLSLLLILFTMTAWGQNRTITGTVEDEKGEALISATVVVKSASGASSIGTSTDFDGHFSLEIPAGENRILVSYIGYEEQVVDITGITNITITMKPSALLLDDVVVTALGIKKEKKALGYAFADVNGDELTTNRDPNFINSLSNKIAGVQISATAGGAGTSSRILIRGIKSLSANSQPLIVIDGIQIDNTADGATWLGGVDYGNSLGGISPDDIETTTVLKGPTAAALYGSKGANGVILITTKSGTQKDKMSITYNTNFTFERPYIVAKYQNVYGAGFGGSMQYQALSQAQRELLGVDSAYYYYSTGSWGPKMNDTLTILNWNNKFSTFSPQPNNVRDYFDNGYTFTNSIAMENGNANTNWRFSAATLDNKGLKPTSTYNRKNVSLNLNSKMNKIISFSMKGSYIREDAFNRVGQGDARTGARTFIWMPRSININTLREDYKSPNGYEQNWYFADDWHTNPYWEAYENYNNDFKDQFQAFARVNFDITSWLSLYIRSSMDNYTVKRYTRVANYALRANGEGSYTEYWKNWMSQKHDFLFSANRSFGEIDISVNAGGSYEKYNRELQSSTITGLAVPNFFTLNNAKYPAETRVGTDVSRKVTNSLYATAQFVYKNWFFTEFTARNDWSSALYITNCSYFYPSVNTSLIFTDAFKINSNVFSFGKLRASAAIVGNDTDPHQLSLSYYNQAYGEIPAIYLGSSYTNPLLEPETTRSFEFGTDLKFFGNRLGIDVTYYDELSYNQILPAEISKSSGFATILTNGGEISNKGVEIQSYLSPLKSENLEWNINLNFARNRNMVVSLLGNLDQYTITGESQIDIVAVPGRPYGEIIGTRLKRYYNDADENDPNNGRPLIGDDGLYIMEERGVIGNVTPDWIGGLTNIFRYKNLSFSFSIGVSKGGSIFSKTNKYGLDNGQFVETLEGRDTWYAATTAERMMGRVGLYNEDGTPMLDGDGDQMFDPNGSDPVGYVADGVLADGSENTKGIDPQVYFHQRKWGGIAELDVYDASYVKLRDVTLNYNLPVQWFKNTFIKEMSCSLVGKNLWLIYSGVPNIDPESAFTSNNNGIGQEYAAMPTARSVGFNLRVTF
ncbi:MAG: SusC/RagA family TonB-linked outer membrane protein [Bacteroidota bacterium]